VDRQQYALGILGLEEEKSQLARGVILVSGGHAGEGDDSDAVSNEPVVTPPVLDFDEPEVTKIKCIWPRTKNGQAKASISSKPVFLDEATVSKLFHLPLHKAAAQLGISNTSFKTACRKVGLKKWPYRTITAAARRTTSASPPARLLQDYLQAKKVKHESSTSPQPLDSFSSSSCSVASLLN
jgi:hypothetical protein